MKKKLAAIVHTAFFSWTMFGLGILFIVLTFFIAVSPESFLGYGYAGVFLFNVISSGLLLFPILVDKLNLPLVILVSALGNIPNTSINYLVGDTSKHMFSHQAFVIKIKHLVEKFGLIMVYILAIIPLPVDLNALLSGYVGIPYRKYILVNFLGKLTIFTLVAYGIVSLKQVLHF